MKKAYYNNDSQDNSNKITFLPTDKIVSEEAIAERKIFIKALQKIDIEYYRSAVPFLDKLDYIGEIILFCINHVATLKKSEDRDTEEKLIEEMMGEVFWRFDYTEYSNHKLFRNYKIQKTREPKKFIYKIDSLNPLFRECILKGKKPESSTDEFEKIKAINDALFPSMVNNNISAISNIVKELLENSYKTLTLFSTANQEKYQHTLQIITYAIQYLKPQFQLKVVNILQEHLKENDLSLSNASKILTDDEYYEQTIKLLKPKLLNATSATHEIYQCMYNLGLSYKELGNFKKAEQWFLEASKGLHNDEDIINDLWFIYISTDKIDEAKKILNDSSQNNKNFCSLALNARKINKKSLESIDKKTLPSNCLDTYKYYEYVSKYNSYSDIEKNKNQKKISDEIKKIIASTKVNKLSKLSLALYTKQNEIALDILKEMPKGFFKTFPNLIRLKALLDPDSVLSMEEKYINTDDTNSILNIAFNSLIAKKG